MMEQYPIAANGLKKMFIGGALSIAGILVAMVIPLLGVLMTLVGGILKLVGLFGARGEDQGYRTAFALTILGIVLSLFTGGQGLFSQALNIVYALVSLGAVYYVCNTTSNLLRTMGRDDVAARGDVVLKIYIVCTVVTVVVDLGALNSDLAVTLYVVATLAGVVAEIMYVIFLNKGSKALVFQTL